MRVLKPRYEIMSPLNGGEILKKIELIGRVCYKSEEKISEGSAEKFVRMIMNPSRKHESVIEHVSIPVRFVCDRGVSHEIVRHRIASYSQESTRYCNYGKTEEGVKFIEPFFFVGRRTLFDIWVEAMIAAEGFYLELLKNGAKPEEARSVLPNSTKTEIVCTFNLREWRHFFSMRAPRTAHPQMREIVVPLLVEFKRNIPVLFDDILFDETFL